MRSVASVMVRRHVYVCAPLFSFLVTASSTPSIASHVACPSEMIRACAYLYGPPRTMHRRNIFSRGRHELLLLLLLHGRRSEMGKKETQRSGPDWEPRACGAPEHLPRSLIRVAYHMRHAAAS